MFTKEDLFKKRKFIDEIKCGIYFLLKKKNIVYVGQSVDIDNRILQHRRDDRKKFDSYSYFECDQSDLNALETMYILHFKPEYNFGWNRNFLEAPFKKPCCDGDEIVQFFEHVELLKSHKWFLDKFGHLPSLKLDAAAISLACGKKYFHNCNDLNPPS